MITIILKNVTKCHHVTEVEKEHLNRDQSYESAIFNYALSN